MGLRTNLISFWEFEDNANDAHGSNNLTEVNTPTYSASGKVNKAIDFESSSSQYCSHADNAGLSLGTDTAFSWNVWFKPESSTATQCLVSKNNDLTTGVEYVIFFRSDNKIQFYAGSSSGSTNQISTDTIADGAWAMVTCWHDPTANTIGVAINDGTPDTTSHTTGTQDTAALLNIGRRVDSASAYTDGLVDQVGFWKKVLSSAEITQLYNSGNGLSYAEMGGLIATLDTTGAMTGDITSVQYPVFSSPITQTRFSSGQIED